MSIGAVRIEMILPCKVSQNLRRIHWNGRREISNRLRVVCGVRTSLQYRVSRMAPSSEGWNGEYSSWFKECKISMNRL